MHYSVYVNDLRVSSYSSMKRAMSDFNLLKSVFNHVACGQNVVYSIHCEEVIE